jgi:UDPglucose--hexose-1-phosphate uridylyltransferase
MVLQDQYFLAFQPFAASHPAETWIVPATHQPFFTRACPETLAALASALLETLRRLSYGFDDPDFNYVFHTSPVSLESSAPEYWHWYVQLLPRMNTTAGFELGTGIQINTMPPEMAAQIMREAPP